jgi:hypothetical protein
VVTDLGEHVTVIQEDRKDEYLFHDYCWTVEKDRMEWYEWMGEIYEGEPDGEDTYRELDDGGYRAAMKDAGRGALLR